jgi:quercetin dioxygenase-like cupin family protein
MEPQIYNAEYTIHVSGADIRFYQMVYSPKKLYTVNHVHSHFELHYITEGSAVYTMNFHDEITLEKGEWLLINRNVYHEEIIQHACGGYVLGFSNNSVIMKIESCIAGDYHER